MTTEEVADSIKNNIDGFFFDLNNTCIKRNKIKNIRSIWETTRNSLRPPAYENLKRGKIYFLENLEALKSDDKITPLMQAGAKIFLYDVKRDDIYDAGIDYCKNNEIPYVRRLINSVRNLNKEAILTTRHVFPDPYVNYFKFDDYVSNFIVFDVEDRFLEFHTHIKTGEDKVAATRQKAKERGLKRWAVMVDGINDIPLMEAEETVLSIASPLGKKEVRKKADYAFKDFEEIGVLARVLEKETSKLEPLIV